MGKRSFQSPSWSPLATGDTTNLANGNHMTIAATGTSSGCQISEIEIGGQSTSGQVQMMMLARNSTVGASLTSLAAPNSDGPMDSFGQSPAQNSYIAAGTPPQRSALTTSARLNFTFNGFGGVIRWVAYPGEEWKIVGTAVNVSESSLSGFSGGGSGNIGAHIIYEPF